MEENQQGEQQEMEQAIQPIVEMGSSTIRTGRGTVHVLTIVGQIEGHQLLPPTSKSTKYEHVMPLLAMVEESEEVDGLLVLLNTVGGDIEAGLGIAELIASMSKPTVSLVLGGGHSIGVPLAVSAKRSFIAPSAAMTIHPVRLNGLVIGVPQTFYYFERIQERILQFVTANSSIKRETFTKLMLQTGELAADGAINDRLADTARGTPMECPPPSTRDTVGFDMLAISSAMPSPASMSPPMVFRRMSRPSTSSLSSTAVSRGSTCSYLVVLLPAGASWCPSIWPTMVRVWMVPS